MTVFDRLETHWLPANSVFLVVALFSTLLVWPNWRVTPLVQNLEPTTEARMDRLEQWLREHPEDGAAATEVARLWRDLGQPAWAHAALREAERAGPREPQARLDLAAAYLDLGALEDATKMLAQAQSRCTQVACTEPLRFKIGLFQEVIALLRKEQIDPRRELVFFAQALQRIVKQVELQRRPK